MSQDMRESVEGANGHLQDGKKGMQILKLNVSLILGKGAVYLTSEDERPPGASPVNVNTRCAASDGGTSRQCLTVTQ